MYLLVKRFFDLVLSLVVLITLLPLFLILAILLRFTGEGYVFYYQKRIGYKNKYFNIIKFATMLKDSPNIGTGEITVRNDPRLTPMGKLLRISKLNEIPQILNVLKGDMSIVGPRPLVDRTYNAYPDEIKFRIYDSKPGITGIGSIIFRDEEELISKAIIPPHDFYKIHIAPYKGALEMWYNKRKSFWVDLCIIFLTGSAILFPKNKLAFRLFKDIPHQENVLLAVADRAQP